MRWIKIKLRESLTPSFSLTIGKFAHVITLICDDQAIKLELQTSNIFLWNFLKEESFDSFLYFMDKSSNGVFRELEYFSFHASRPKEDGSWSQNGLKGVTHEKKICQMGWGTQNSEGCSEPFSNCDSRSLGRNSEEKTRYFEAVLGLMN